MSASLGLVHLASSIRAARVKPWPRIVLSFRACAPAWKGTRVNRFEQAIHDCMIPTAKLLDQTVKPLHRAMLLNFWRHVHLEGAGEYGQIVAPDMMVDHPVYRVTWGASPA